MMNVNWNTNHIIRSGLTTSSYLIDRMRTTIKIINRTECDDYGYPREGKANVGYHLCSIQGDTEVYKGPFIFSWEGDGEFTLNYLDNNWKIHHVFTVIGQGREYKFDLPNVPIRRLVLNSKNRKTPITRMNLCRVSDWDLLQRGEVFLPEVIKFWKATGNSVRSMKMFGISDYPGSVFNTTEYHLSWYGEHPKFKAHIPLSAYLRTCFTHKLTPYVNIPAQITLKGLEELKEELEVFPFDTIYLEYGNEVQVQTGHTVSDHWLKMGRLRWPTSTKDLRDGEVARHYKTFKEANIYSFLETNKSSVYKTVWADHPEWIGWLNQVKNPIWFDKNDPVSQKWVNGDYIDVISLGCYFGHPNPKTPFDPTRRKEAQNFLEKDLYTRLEKMEEVFQYADLTFNKIFKRHVYEGGYGSYNAKLHYTKQEPFMYNLYKEMLASCNDMGVEEFYMFFDIGEETEKFGAFGTVEQLGLPLSSTYAGRAVQDFVSEYFGLEQEDLPPVKEETYEEKLDRHISWINEQIKIGSVSLTLGRPGD